MFQLCEVENPPAESRQRRNRVNKKETKRLRRGGEDIICHDDEGQSGFLLTLPSRTAERCKQIVYRDFQGLFISFNDAAL